VTVERITENGGDRIKISCNGCGAEAPPASEILAGHGLNNMGWQCLGGTHLCPSCKPQETEK
jgi:hypothetical protein